MTNTTITLMAALRSAQSEFESARRSGLRGADLAPMLIRLKAAESALIDDARQLAKWRKSLSLPISINNRNSFSTQKGGKKSA